MATYSFYSSCLNNLKFENLDWTQKSPNYRAVFNDSGTGSGGGAGESSAESGRIHSPIIRATKRNTENHHRNTWMANNCHTSLPVQSSVDIVNVHQRVQFLSFAGVQDERFNTKRFTERVQSFIFIQTFLYANQTSQSNLNGLINKLFVVTTVSEF